MPSIVSDESIRSGEPRIEGSRVSVLDVKRRVIDVGEDPHVVAGEYDLTMAQLFHALAYYYEHRQAFAVREREAEAARAEGEVRTAEELGVPSGWVRRADAAADRRAHRRRRERPGGVRPCGRR